MSVSPTILNKVKLLLNLSKSQNKNEADNARTLADKLIEKHSITEEDLASLEDKVYYGENEKLFVTIGIIGWRQQLALAVANYFECQIVQEELVPAEGVHQFSYFVYGDPDQVKDVQFVYHAFSEKVEKLSDVNCLGRGPIYIDSYCEGIIESIKHNISLFGIDLPKVNKDLKEEIKTTESNSENKITKSKDKDEPTDKRVDVNSQSMIKDIMAYFKGVDDGKYISLEEILELAVKSVSVPEIDVHR